MDTKQYWEQLADLYQVRDATTDWLLGYPYALKSLGDLNGKTILDYGCGNGEFSRHLARLFPLCRVIGVDTSESAIKNARQNTSDTFRVEYYSIKTYQDLDQFSFDVAVSNFVFCCMPNIDTSKGTVQKIYSILPEDGIFVLQDPHPSSHGHKYISFQSDSAENRKSGDKIHVRLFTNSLDIEFDDYYWTAEDYQEIFADSGFKVEEVHSPIAHDIDQEQLYSENQYPPFIIYKVRK